MDIKKEKNKNFLQKIFAIELLTLPSRYPPLQAKNQPNTHYKLPPFEWKVFQPPTSI